MSPPDAARNLAESVGRPCRKCPAIRICRRMAGQSGRQSLLSDAAGSDRGRAGNRVPLPAGQGGRLMGRERGSVRDTFRSDTRTLLLPACSAAPAFFCKFFSDWRDYRGFSRFPWWRGRVPAGPARHARPAAQARAARCCWPPPASPGQGPKPQDPAGWKARKAVAWPGDRAAGRAACDLRGLVRYAP